MTDAELPGDNEWKDRNLTELFCVSLAQCHDACYKGLPCQFDLTNMGLAKTQDGATNLLRLRQSSHQSSPLALKA